MALEKGKFRLKYYINYLLILAALILILSMDLTGNLKRSDAQLFSRIGYSIMLAVSLNLVVGFLGELSLGHAGFMCVGAYVGGLCSNLLRAKIESSVVILLISLLVGGFAAALCGFLIGVPTLRLKGDYLAIVTLAFGEIIRTVFRNQEIFGGSKGLVTSKFGYNLYIVAFVGALLTVFVAQNLRRSKHGRAVQAIRDNEIAARAMGVPITYYKLMVFVLAAFFAGLAGVIYANQFSPILSSSFDFNYSIEILVMVVLGGMGNVTGSMIAAALLTFINVKLTVGLSGDLAALKNLIYALILIVAVMWNNAPFLRPTREKVHAKIDACRLRLLRRTRAADGGVDAPEAAVWDKIPTKIPMDSILSTELTPDLAPDDEVSGETDEEEAEK